MSGYLGTAYVPGRLSSPLVIFTSSLPHLVVSTIFLAILSIFNVVSHFRSGKGDNFTLINIATVLHGSELPEQFAELKNEVSQVPRSQGDHKVVQEEVLEMMGNRRILLEVQDDGNGVLHVN